MALVSLAEIKLQLGVTSDGDNALLAQLIRQASAVIRRYCKRYLGGVVSSISAAAAAVVTCYGHELKTGDSVYLEGTNCTPTIDGARVVTVLSADTFSVPVTTTAAGTAGSFARTYVEFYCGNGQRELLLREWPVISVASVYEDGSAAFGEASGAFAASTLLTAGSDYCLARDNGQAVAVSSSGILFRIGGRWPGASERLAGLLTSSPTSGIGNIKVTYTAGYSPVPYDLRLAAMSFISLINQGRGKGGALKSESLEYYSYTLASSEDFGSIRSVLSSYKPVVL